jgi:hypothetical protein
MTTQAQITQFFNQLIVWFSQHFSVMRLSTVYAMPLTGGGPGGG